MNTAMKNQILSELDRLPDRKGYSLLNYLHFLMKEEDADFPNEETLQAIEQADRDRASLKAYSSAEEIFQDLGLDD